MYDVVVELLMPPPPSRRFPGARKPEASMFVLLSEGCIQHFLIKPQGLLASPTPPEFSELYMLSRSALELLSKHRPSGYK